MNISVLWYESGALKLILHQWKPLRNITKSLLCCDCFSSLAPLLTPLLTADPVAQTSTDHLLAALASEPALSVVEGGSRVCAARPLDRGLGLLPRTVGGHHDSTCGCKPPNRMKE